MYPVTKIYSENDFEEDDQKLSLYLASNIIMILELGA